MRGVADQAEGVGDVVDQAVERDQPPLGRRLAGAAIGERRLGVGDGAVERGDQLRREALHRRVGQAADAVGEELRRGEEVAQVVVDLRHGEAEIGEMALLAERPLQVALHAGEMLLGDADLVAAAARHDHASGILGLGREGDHVLAEPADGAHDQPVQAEIEQRAGDHRNQRRQPEDAHRIAEHRGAQRPVAHDQLDLRAAPRNADHAQHVLLPREERAEGVDDVARRVHHAQVGGDVDRRRHVDGRDQPAGGAVADGDRGRADGGEEIVLDLARHLDPFGADDDQGRRVGHGQAIRQPARAEIGDRGNVDQHLARHDEEDGEEEELPRQAEPARAFQAQDRGGAETARQACRSVVHQPNFLRNSMMRCCQGGVKPGP